LMTPARFACLLIVLAVLLAASLSWPAGPICGKTGPDCVCTITHNAWDYMGDGYQKGYIVNTYMGDGCKPGADAAVFIGQTGSMHDPYTFIDGVVNIPPGNFRFIPADQVMAAKQNIDCVPWIAYIRMLGRGSVSNSIPEAWVSINGTVIDHSDERGSNADTLYGCAPVVQMKEGGATESTTEGAAEIVMDGGRLYVYANLVAESDPEDYLTIEKEAFLDPWVTVDPAWPYASLYTVYAQTCPGCSTYLPLRRDWMDVWTDVSTPAMATPDNAQLATFVDVDNDGDLDIHVSTGGSTPDRLYLNDGAGGFTESASGPLATTVGIMGLAWGLRQRWRSGPVPGPSGGSRKHALAQRRGRRVYRCHRGAAHRQGELVLTGLGRLRPRRRSRPLRQLVRLEHLQPPLPQRRGRGVHQRNLAAHRGLQLLALRGSGRGERYVDRLRRGW
jgi:hypothetical protein